MPVSETDYYILSIQGTTEVESGENSEIVEDISNYQKRIQVSKGYHEYCSKLLYQSGMFFPSIRKQNLEYLSSQRHNSPEKQKEYDKHYGLVFYKSPSIL